MFINAENFQKYTQSNSTETCGLEVSENVYKPNMTIDEISASN